MQLQVQMANGTLLPCSSYFPSATWYIQDYEFQSDLKVLPITSYDMILGLDWLTQFSPMKIHWGQQWVSLPYQGSVITLCGLLNIVPPGTVIQLIQLEDALPQEVSSSHPLEIQQLLHEFCDLFTIPRSLPPSRPYDHAIPLIPGASPVSSRPYHFAPAIKDEIERQVQEMLSAGLIQKSSSPFTSSVLLVKKKDSSWRFCVDYKQLNAITTKGQYPVPIIDEFLDELGSASWFSSLDLRSGFHQILLKPGEEHKTAFKTHFGQFEFGVMPFGLTGAREPSKML